MFEKAIENLKKTMGVNQVANIQKSDLAGDGSATNDHGSVDIGDLASEAVVLFETGELQPDIDSVSGWAREKGVPDSDVSEFSSSVVDAYFDDSDGGGEVSPIDDGDGGDMGVTADELEEVNKSILALKEGQSLIAEGLNKVLEKDKRINDLESEVSVLKSKLSELEKTPSNAGKKTPVMDTSPNPSQQIQKGFAPSNPAQAKEFELLILKGIKSGDLSLEEMSYFEATGKLSENAASYVNVQKIEGNK